MYRLWSHQKLGVTQNQIKLYEGVCSTAITGIVAPLVAYVFCRMTNLSMAPPVTPDFNIGFIHSLEKFGTLLELLHHPLVPSFEQA